MKNSTLIPVPFIMIALFLSSCEAIKTIFNTGLGIGVFITITVVVIVLAVIGVIKKIGGK